MRRAEIDQSSASIRSILERSLAGVVAYADSGVSVGVLGGPGSGRSSLMDSVCQRLLRADVDAWVMVPFDASAQLPAQICGAHQSKSNALITRTFLHSLFKCSKPDSCFDNPVSFVCCLFRELALLLRFVFLVRYRICLALLLAGTLFVSLLSALGWEVVSGLAVHSVSLLEVGGFLALVGSFVVIVRLLCELFQMSPEKMTFAELVALFHIKSKPLFGGHKRIVVVATGFHTCALEELPHLLENLQAVLNSTQATVMYELDPQVTLAAFAAEYRALGLYQQNVQAQRIARERLCRLITVPVNLDLLFDGHLQSQSIGSERPAVKLNERQLDLLNKWCAQFGLNSPRQQHRMRYSYQLLLQLYGEEEAISKGNNSTLDNLTADITCPLLITLCALEYVNNLADQGVRDEFMLWLLRVSQRGFAEEAEKTLAEIDVAGRLNDEIVSIVNRYSTLVKPFVLPALERLDSFCIANPV